jgi:glycosyltransferase involved in cell wall biosynthesis
VLAAEHFQQVGYRVELITLLPDQEVLHVLPLGVNHIDLGASLHRAIAKQSGWSRVLHRLLARICVPFVGPFIVQSINPRIDADWIQRWMLWCCRGIVGPRADLLMAHWRDHPPRRVLSFLSKTNLVACLALWSKEAHLVVSERNDLRRDALPAEWRALRPLLFQRADVVTANAQGTLDSLRAITSLKDLMLLPNPLPQVAEGPSKVGQNYGFLTIARAVQQKGLDLLIEAFAVVLDGSESMDSWSLTLVGDGPERVGLEALAVLCGVRHRIRFLGHCHDVRAELAAAAVFVLPSRKEGMPNALLEAMAAGLAVIVNDASPGPLEFVTHGQNGLVVPHDDAAALARAMLRLQTDPQLRIRLGLAAQDRLKSQDWPVLEPIWKAALAME